MSKCVNCGERMQPYYARNGNTIFICGNTRLKIVKRSMVPYGYIYCAITPNAQARHAIKFDQKECLELHAKFVSLKNTFDTFSALAPTHACTLDKLKTAVEHTVNDITLLESANLALMLGLPANNLDALFSCAMKLGQALGIGTEKAITSLARGIGRRSRLILDNIGIAFSANEAYTKYPELDKTKAWQQYAIKLIEEKAQVLEVNPKQVEREQSKAHIENLKVKFGEELSKE